MIINRISKALINPTFLTNKSNHIGTSPQYSNDNYANILDAMNKMSSLNKAQISFGAGNINAKDKIGYTALMCAAWSGNSETVQELLRCDGIDVNAKDKHGYTALMIAARYGNPEKIKALLNCDGIDVNAKDKLGNTALMYAAWNWNSNPETFKALQNFIANKNA